MSSLTHASNMTESVVQLRLALSPRRRVLGRLRRTANIWIGSVILLVVILLAIFAPILTSYNPLAVIPADRLLPPDGQHLFGTDDFGRDVFTRVIYGGRLSIQVGLISIALASFTGTFLGITAGYFGSWVDAVVMRLIDLMLAFPSI